MESELIENKSAAKIKATMSSSSSNQLYIADNLDLPEDTFRMSLDNFSVIGENVTIAERQTSTESGLTLDTPDLEIPTLQPPDAPAEISSEKSPPITETPKVVEKARPHLPPLSLIKNDDVFVKPSPVADLMSPAKTLQFEMNFGSAATPTMKRAAIDFDFFEKNNFDEYFQDVEDAKKTDIEKKESEKDGAFKETAVIVEPNTVRHEIGYGKYLRYVRFQEFQRFCAKAKLQVGI